MAAAKTPGSSAWARWLQAQLDERGWRQADLRRASGDAISRAQASRWLAGAEVTVDDVATGCAALGVPIELFLAAAGYMTRDRAVVVPRDVGALTKRQLQARQRELIDEIFRRVPADVAETADSSAVTGGRSAVAAMRPVPIVRPEGRRGTDWAARRGEARPPAE